MRTVRPSDNHHAKLFAIHSMSPESNSVSKRKSGVQFSSKAPIQTNVKQKSICNAALNKQMCHNQTNLIRRDEGEAELVVHARIETVALFPTGSSLSKDKKLFRGVVNSAGSDLVHRGRRVEVRAFQRAGDQVASGRHRFRPGCFQVKARSFGHRDE